MSRARPVLNPNQARAVAWEDGPLLVLAGPGSGKTEVLTQRVARLLREREDIGVLALTFTNKAANEMRTRVEEETGGQSPWSRTATFHAFATDLLRQHGSHVGLKPNFTLLTSEDERLEVLDEAMRASSALFEEESPDRRAVLSLFERLCAEGYAGEDTAPLLSHTPAWLPGLFRQYNELLVRLNYQDFGSVLLLATRLLSTRPAIVRVTRMTWTHICVDEFQDTNRAQVELLRLLVDARQPNLFVVADDDQLIYQWNGASPERIAALQKDFQMEVMQLPQNYRCPAAIVDLANLLIAHNHTRTSGKAALVPQKMPLPDKLNRLRAFADQTAEATGVATEITARGFAPADCVVLARSGRELERVEAVLRAQGLPAWRALRKTEFQTAPVALLHGLLRLANARQHRVSATRVCAAWSQVASTTLTLDDLAAEATLRDGDLLRAWFQRAQYADLSAEQRKWLTQVGARLVERLDFLWLVDGFLDAGFLQWADDPDVKEEQRAWSALHDEVLNRFGKDGLTLHLYLQELDLRDKIGPPPPGAIRLYTIHGSKGLEFRHVFLVGMAEGVFPSFQAVKRGDQSREMEEERRSCFVAITRVQETLTLSWARRYGGYERAPSRFLREMGFSVDR